MPFTHAPRPPAFMFAPGGPPVPIFLNRNGGTYYAGTNDSGSNSTSILSSGQASVNAYPWGDPSWQQVVACVQQQFARFNVEVTDQPPSTVHVEAVVGGNPSQLSLPSGVGGVAPIDPYYCEVVDRAVVFIFAETLGNNPQLICEVVAQEVAHSFSLDHEFYCQDPMTYLRGCGAKSFQDYDAPCGEGSARQCICGRSSQNSVQIMYQKLGAADGTTSSGGSSSGDLSAPTVDFLSPADGAALPANSVIDVIGQASDDVGVTSVELLWYYNSTAFPCPYQGQSATCTVSGGRYTWQLRVGTGSRQFRLRARDGAGHETVTAPRTITLTDGSSGGGTDTTPPSVSIVRPANGAQLQANAQMEIEATAADDVSVARLELLWERTGDVFLCPSSRSDVTCAINGSRYTWSLPVGDGSRSFSVRAVDSSGNTAETGSVMVDLVANPPPPDTRAPLVILTRPSNGQVLPENTIIEIAADVTDDVGVTAVELHFGAGGDIYPCPGASVTASCTQQGSAYVWRVAAGTGSAPIQVFAQDGAGNRAESTAITIQLGASGGGSSSGGGAADPGEPNNDAATATRVNCGQDGAYVLADVDFYVVSTQDGDNVMAEVTGADATPQWLLGDHSVGETTLDAVHSTASAYHVPGGDLVLRVTPNTSASQAYNLAVRCRQAEVRDPLPFHCAAAGPGWPWLAVLVLALRRRR
ncbi:MAG: Ig-like domain-containing protein [Deltaproteobacteria bacterium]|nr:Ig-like domain-containing protein [Deltaproteobacteria bacterium]